jgi:hypothetical protein
MTVLGLLDRYAELLQIALLLIVTVTGFRYARKSEGSLWLIFYLLAMSALLLSEVYWVAHKLIRGDVRIPFAANDIAECGLFLLLAAALRAAAGGKGVRMPGVTIASAAFAAANILLWLGWSGEWLRDILGGLPFAYFLVICARSLYHTGALRRVEWIGLGGASFLILFAELTSILGASELQITMERTGYILLSVVTVWFLIRCILALAGRGDPDPTLSLCVSGYCWIFVSMYMSAEVWYTLTYTLSIVFTLFTFLAVRRKARRA